MTQKSESLKHILRELGLTEHENNLYRLSLDLGPTSIAQLAEHMGISRPNIYKVIAGLEAVGLARFSDRKKRRDTFVVESPRVVLDRLRETRNQLERLDTDFTSVLPTLLASYSQGDSPYTIRIINNLDDARSEFRRLAEHIGDRVDVYGLISPFSQGLGRVLSFRPERIHVRALVADSFDAGSMPANIVMDVKNLIGDGHVASFEIFDHAVLIWQSEADSGVLIEDQYIAQMMRTVFDCMWTAG